MEYVITQRGVEIPKTRDHTEMCRKVRESLTCHYPPPSRDILKAYNDVGDRYIVPHYWAVEQGLLLRDTRAVPQNTPMTFQGDVRETQSHAIGASLESMRACGGAVLHLGTGQGKTVCALKIATELGHKTVVLVHKKFLADQWAQRIRQFVPGATISYIQGTQHDTNGDFVIAMIQTLISRKYHYSMFTSFGLMIFDEAHRVAAKVFSSAMFSLNVTYTLGLSATPTRLDGMHPILHWFLGPLVTPSPSTNFTSRQRVVVKRVAYTCDAYRTTQPPMNRRGDIDHASMITSIAENIERTRMIVTTLVPSDTDVLILSHRRAQCETMVQMLRERGMDAALYIGGTKSVPTSKIIVSTYALVSEGFDEPRLSTLILATPGSNVTQAVGRVLRNPKSTPIIYDVVDAWSTCYAQFAKRRRIYTTLGFNVEKNTSTQFPPILQFVADE